MHCPKCGAYSNSNGSFCPHCGSPYQADSFFTQDPLDPFAPSPAAPLPKRRRKLPVWVFLLAAMVGIASFLSAVLPAKNERQEQPIDTYPVYTTAPVTAGLPVQPEEPVTAAPPQTTAVPETKKVPVIVHIGDREKTTAVTAATSATTKATIVTAATTKATTTTVATTKATTTATTTAATTASRESVQDRARRIIPYFDLRYFLTRLDDNDLAFICAVYEGVMNFETKIVVPHTVPSDRVDTLTMLMIEECPELFQVDFWKSYTYNYNSDDIVTSISVPYVYTQTEYKKMRNDCEYVINTLAQQAKGLSEFEKEKLVFDFIFSKCVYDIPAPYSSDAYGTLVHGRAKCDGISLAMKWAMEAMGIQCLCITGDGVPEDHSWNIIRIDGKYYTLDVTENVPKIDRPDLNSWGLVYSSMNVSDAFMLENFTVRPFFSELPAIPACNSWEQNYHAKNGNIVYKGQDPSSLLHRGLQSAMQNGSGTFYIQFEDSTEFNAFTKQVDTLIHNWANANCNTGASWSTFYRANMIAIQFALR